MSRRGLQLLLLLILSLSAGAPALADADAPFLWQVQGPKATHYLLGSVHLLPRTEELPVGIQDAYDAVEGLVFETDVSALDKPEVREALLAAGKSPSTLKQQIGDKMYAQTVHHAVGIRMKPTACDSMKPWLCAMVMEVVAMENAGLSPENGIDKVLAGWAQADDKEIHWFEPPASHLGLFTNMSEALSREFLASSLDDSGGTAGDDAAELLRAWKDNDVAAIETIDKQLKAGYPEVYQRLLSDRNGNWMPQLKRIIDSGEPQMVVVGAAHLVGPDGLIARLRARGYKVLPYVAIESQLVTMNRPQRAPID